MLDAADAAIELAGQNLGVAASSTDSANSFFSLRFSSSSAP
jgi:hypothetical protein